MNTKRRICLLTLAALLLAFAAASADGTWYCPQCGRLNDGNFCPADGTRKPDGLNGAAAPAAAAPTDLMFLTPYYISSGVEIVQKPIRDTMGNRYSSCIRGYNSPEEAYKYNSDCCAIWDIGGRYTSLEATCIVREKDRGTRHEASFKIYGDGKLLYEKSGISGMTKPFPVQVSLRGVTDLKIVLYGSGNMGTAGINAVLADVTIR